MGRQLPVGLLSLLLLLGARFVWAQADPDRGIRLRVNERRLALVIGNNDYLHAPKLRNAGNDADDLDLALREVGFQVDKVTDADLRGMERGINAFVGKLRPGDVALFHYSGHAMEIDGQNYLLPVDFLMTDEASVRFDSYPALKIHDRIAASGSRLNVVILDACRNNGFRTSRSSGGGGLASMEAAAGSFIAFSTSPRSVAEDGQGRNGLFTGWLLAALRQPGLSLYEVFDRVREGVYEASNRGQLPWISSSVIGQFYFRPAVGPAVGGAGVDAAFQVEMAFWEPIKASRNPAAFELYLSEYPQGRFAGLARLKLDELRAPGDSPQVEPAPQQVASAPLPGEVRQNAKDGLEYAWIPAGTFQMGCAPGDSECYDDEKPRHEVKISNGFWMGRSAVTVEAYERFAGATGRDMPPAPDFNEGWRLKDHPIVRVTWDDAKAYCEWSGGRLPTEAEWEYAARGGKDGLKFPWGNELSHEKANYGKDKCCAGLAQGRDRWEYTSPVGSFEANGFGLYDVAGNVWEWVADWYGSEYYADTAVMDPHGPFSGEKRALRGGSWVSVPWNLRVSYRGRSVPGYGNVSDVGFRCLRESFSP